ncbi:hypothetical protein EDB83DRAFT_1749970 [Lactarius deliciosus]|nr:hypothetical protein EDB83DRAFT_1749970 [Lactarius deliciosus]
MNEWTPEPLGAPLTQEEQRDLASAPVVSGANRPWPKLANTSKQVLNLSSYDFTGLAGNETNKVRAIETLWKYGVSCCGPLGFHGTIGASGVRLQCAFPAIDGFNLQMDLELNSRLPRYRCLNHLLAGILAIPEGLGNFAFYGLLFLS